MKCSCGAGHDSHGALGGVTLYTANFLSSSHPCEGADLCGFDPVEQLPATLLRPFECPFVR